MPMAAIVGIWGFIHTGGFLIGQTRSTSEAPEAPELAASLMVSLGNAGVTLGTFLGGLVITHFGIHQVIFISILLLLVALALTYVFVGRRRKVTEPPEQIEQEQELEIQEMLAAESALEV